MLLAKVNNGAITEYPYELERLREDNPNTSFALPLNIGDLQEYNVVEVEEIVAPSYNATTERLVENPPVYEGGVWKQNWVVVGLTVEEQDTLYNAQATWGQFYNDLLISDIFIYVRTQASVYLGINAAYTDLANALVLATLGLVNIPAVQACFTNTVTAMDNNGVPLSTLHLEELNYLLSENHLDRLITVSPATNP